MSPCKIFIALFVLFLPAAAAAETERFALQTNLDHVWTMTAAVLVFFMQAGFLLLEAGSVRAKNSINVAQKNLMDFLISTAAFGIIGFSLMFGPSLGGWIGFGPDLVLFGLNDPWTMTFFTFQLVFCGTAATIVSGAAAERMSMAGYVVLTLAIGCVIYPVAGHWSWGGLLTGSEEPFLAKLGFIDFAGSTVVHSVGAWAALAAVVAIGARNGKFDDEGKPVTLHGHSPILATLGAIILWVGWIGFNGGSTTVGSSSFAHIIVNTMIAGGMGGLAQMAIGRLRHGFHRPEFMVNGLLGGLVAITAGCDAVTAQSAAIIGFSGGLVAYFARELLENKFKLDDPVGAIAVHGFSGAWGTILAGVFATNDMLLAASRTEQILVQMLGVAIYFVWSFGMASLVLIVASKLLPAPSGPRPRGGGLRVSTEDELVGLNITEHHAPLGLASVVKAMHEIVENPNADIQEIELDPGDESYEVGALFNQIARDIRERRDEERANSMSTGAIESFIEQLSDLFEAYEIGDFSKNLPDAQVPPQFKSLAAMINGMAQAMSQIMGELQLCLTAISQGDLTQRSACDKEGPLGQIQIRINESIDGLSSVMDSIEHVVVQASNGVFATDIPTEDRKGFLLALCEGVNAMNAATSSSLTDLSRTVAAVTKGDLGARMSDIHIGEFEQIAQHVNTMTETLSTMVREMEQSNQIAVETAQLVSSQNNAVKATARHNFDLTVAISKRLEDLKAENEGNSQRFVDALDLTQSVRKAIGSTRALSLETVDRMGAASVAVKEITSSISAITDISSQTHLLSLNASVEAARAGEEGKGFAVVANEVRDLAARSAKMTTAITEHVSEVDGTVSATHDGVTSTNEALQQVDEDVVKTTALVQEINDVGSTVIDGIVAMTVDFEKIKNSAEDTRKMVEESDLATQKMLEAIEQASEKFARFTNPTQNSQKAKAA